MSDILTDYREWRSTQDQRIGTHSDRCHLWHERCFVHRLAAELERTRDELASATRHMEMAEAAWLRATMDTLPTLTTPGECSVPGECRVDDKP